MTARALFALPAAALAILAIAPMSAAADGLPGEGVVANPVSAPGGDVGYVTRTARHHTILREQTLASGRTLRKLRLSGTFVVPAVAYDGSPSGLSADGRTLVLIKPRDSWPRKRTSFAVIDAKSMHLRRRFSLPGDFSFDAISPNGRLVYMVQYLSPNDVTAYAVRAYDMRARRLFRAPVVDKSEPDEDMRGTPLARVSDAHGRWAYTLYDGAEHPFVHALDTEGRTAVCIDLDVRAATLAMQGRRLDVMRHGRVVASINTVTHRLVRDQPAAVAEDDAGTSWLPIAGPTTALLLLAAVGRRRLVATRTAAP
jgi:hypothetical protein